MAVFAAVCYLLGSICFLVALAHFKIMPRSLDIIALGLFFCSLPMAVKHL